MLKRFMTGVVVEEELKVRRDAELTLFIVLSMLIFITSPHPAVMHYARLRDRIRASSNWVQDER